MEHPIILQDLRMRLQNARISHEPLEDSDNFEYGFNANFLRTIIRYWAEKFDWRKQEAIINRFPQFTTEIEGLKVHFIRAKPPAKKYSRIVPLLIVHGFNQWSTARVFRKMMLRLGHNKFLLQGGDWGSLVCTNIALYYPQHVLGLHLNMAFVSPLFSLKAAFLSIVGSISPSTVFSSVNAYSFSLKKLFFTMLTEGAHFHMHSTDPDTLGKKLTMDELLTILSIYWINGNIVNSQRYYKEFFLSPQGDEVERYVKVFFVFFDPLASDSFNDQRCYFNNYF
ncbi:unnamed protein product [Toxocara canis]|uniref:EHN domain-containing protein n=1 Tax=Toxocara canis TaxID=6265 RepID=A0A183UAI8_TOXCA|nr:unnamed protein product [Toxocara canis]